MPGVAVGNSCDHRCHLVELLVLTGRLRLPAQHLQVKFGRLWHLVLALDTSLTSSFDLDRNIDRTGIDRLLGLGLDQHSKPTAESVHACPPPVHHTS